MTPPAIGLDKPYHLMHCKQRSYDNHLAVGKHVVMVHTIQTHDIQTELNTSYPVHFPMTKTKLEEFEVGKSMSEGHPSTHHRQCTSKHTYNMFAQWSFYILLIIIIMLTFRAVWLLHNLTLDGKLCPRDDKKCCLCLTSPYLIMAEEPGKRHDVRAH